jgi:hypothetical protein
MLLACCIRVEQTLMADPVSRLGEIRARREAATDGPWQWIHSTPPSLEGPNYATVIEAEHDGGCACRQLCEQRLEVTTEDQEFIAGSWADVGWLLEHIEQQRRQLIRIGEVLHRRESSLAEAIPESLRVHAARTGQVTISTGEVWAAIFIDPDREPTQADIRRGREIWQEIQRERLGG